VADELEVIRDEMEQTRANLAGKLEALETQVRETVSGASEAVTSTVEGVKEVVGTVSETVGSVAETFNIGKQIEQHPWAAFGIAVATGFAASQLFGRSGPAPAPQPRYEPARSLSDLPLQPQVPAQPQPQPESQGLGGLLPEGLKGMLPSLDDLIPDMSGAINTAISSLSGLAVGTVMGVVREVAVNGLPEEWKGELSRMIDDVTTKLGGKKLQPLASQESNGSTHQDEKADRADRSEDRLARLEDLPSPRPPHQQSGTQSEGESNPRSKRGGRSQVGNKV
jgi:ElaB/YqjD/DUF883 family membrane-anchored ribosome-binding protein